MSNQSRRSFITSVGLLGAASMNFGTLPILSNHTPQNQSELKLGLATYSTRKYTLEETLEIAKTVGLPRLSIKDKFHLPINQTPANIKIELQKIKNSGIKFYGGGVFYMKTKEEVDNVFEYAKLTGISTIVGVPTIDLIPVVNKKIKEYDIMVAVHNHGPEDETYPTCESIYELIQNLDSRFGLCMDIGHTQRCGINPADEIIRFKDRLLDLHLKDVSKAETDGEELEIGRGVIDIPAVIKALKTIDYKYVASFEFEKDPENILPGLSESVGYVKGIIDSV